MAGNRRFTSGSLTAPGRNLAILKQNTAEKQEPFAASAFLRGLPSAGGVGFRSDYRTHFRYPRRRQYCHLGDYRQPGIWRGGAGRESDAGHGPRQLRRRKSHHPGQRGSRPDQRPLSPYSAGGREGRNNLEAATKANAQIQATLLQESSTVLKGLIKEGKLKLPPPTTILRPAR